VIYLVRKKRVVIYKNTNRTSTFRARLLRRQGYGMIIYNKSSAPKSRKNGADHLSCLLD
jgi:hypothetical protein